MLTRQRSGLRVLGILVHRHPAAAAATGKELPRRAELAGHRNGECGSALGAQRLRAPPGPGPQSHLPLQLPGLAEGPSPQLHHPVGADAVEGPASCRGAPARLHPASPWDKAWEARADCSEAVAGAGMATHTLRSTGRLQAQNLSQGPRRRVAGVEYKGDCGGAGGGPSGEGGPRRGRGGSRLSARGGAFSPEQSARRRRR